MLFSEVTICSFLKAITTATTKTHKTAIAKTITFPDEKFYLSIILL
jgi:hypothetical protein